MNGVSLIHPLIALLAAPLLPGVINRTKAFFAGRKGPPLLQLYFDLARLLRKGATYSRTTTWVFRAGPIVSLAAMLAAVWMLPLGRQSAPLAFAGDLIVVAYLLGLARFAFVLAALDTGSAFEGMGASREVQFSALAEPALLLGLAAIARQTSSLSLSAMFAGLTGPVWVQAGPWLAVVAAAIFLVYLTENARIPVDDPNTHLELTMIHEVMVLDHSGPDFAFVLYGASLKLWILGSLLVGLLVSGCPLASFGLFGNVALSLIAMFLLAVLTGVIESCMARLRMLYVPLFLLAATVLSAIGLLLALRN